MKHSRLRWHNGGIMPRPEEGLIHAWLDGQLPPDEAARIEELAATDPEWAAAVAEARGFVAASSRILSALDRVPADVVPKGAASRPMRLPWWTKVAAAVVVVVGGSVVVLQNTPEGSVSTRSTEQGSAQPTPDTQKTIAQAPAATPAVGVPPAAGSGKSDATAMRREALAASPVTPPAAPVLSVGAVAAEERKSVQDAGRMMAEVSAAKSLVAKAAPTAAPTAAQSVAPSALPRAQRTSNQDLAQAQSAKPAQRVMGGVSTALSAQEQQANLCYRLVPDSSRIGAAVIMRAVRADGDTLRLTPVDSTVSQRAWIVWRDGMKGIMTTSGDLRSAVQVVATPTTCPAP
ncbi:MAG: anti-sigma factor family protein [Gemmatimonadaceae bacterium]